MSHSTDEELLINPSHPDTQDEQEHRAAAFHRGCDAVEAFSRSEVSTGPGHFDRLVPEQWLTGPRPDQYIRSVIEPAHRSGLLSTGGASWWRDGIAASGEDWDVRVAEFMNGWRTRGEEILSIQRSSNLRRAD